MKDLKLWGIFISLIIVVQALGFFVFSGIAWCLFHAGILSPDHPPMGWFPFLTNTCSSALISLCITTVISHHFFRPIQDLVHALEQVSAGNFDVRLKENDIWYEVREMNLNFNDLVCYHLHQTLLLGIKHQCIDNSSSYDQGIKRTADIVSCSHLICLLYIGRRTFR